MLTISLVIAMATTSARAGTDEWRDGCPAGMREHYKRADYHMGAVPDPASGLTQDRLTVAESFGYAHLGPGAENHLSNVLTAHLHAEGLLGTTRLALDLLAPWRRDELAGDGIHGGTVRFGLRANYQSSLDVDAFGDGDRKVSGIRKAWAVQGFYSHGLTDGLPVFGGGADRISDVLTDRTLSARYPFEFGGMSPEGSGGALVEYRMEQVGCQALFVHLTGQALAMPWAHTLREGAPFTTSLYSYDVTAAAGLMIGERLTVYGQYGLSVLQLGTHDLTSYHRLRLGADLALRRTVSFGGYIDFRTQLRGIAVGLSLAISTDKWGGYKSCCSD